MKNQTTNILILISLLALAACSAPPANLDHDDGKLNVVATTTFVGETVQIIGGDDIALTFLLSPGENPHTYEPTPRDMTTLANADIIFINGLGLEVFIDDMLENVSDQTEILSVSDGIITREIGEKHDGDDDHDDDDGETHGTQDPHVWMSPRNIMQWANNIANALSRLDEDHADQYRANAEAYLIELEALDSWVGEQMAQIPEENRVLVSDHLSFGYLADDYGLEQIGAVIPALTTEAAPSGQALAELQDLIREHNVQAIFVSFDFDPSIAERVAEDTGTALINLYLGSLTPAGGPADTYIRFTHYNADAIVKALK
ncbi:MAG: metal ABC transporter substrate-binding protein [Chloroflexota bacterium]